jgi:hypothetical protein
MRPIGDAQARQHDLNGVTFPRSSTYSEQYVLHKESHTSESSTRKGIREDA